MSAKLKSLIIVLPRKVEPNYLYTLRIAGKIIRDHPDYRFYTNNCQNFVLYLLNFACQEPVTPKTIKLSVNGMLEDLSLKADRKGGGVVLVVLFD